MNEFEPRGLPKNAITPIVYLSGENSHPKGMTPEEETDILVSQAEVKHRCFSYAYCGEGMIYFSKGLVRGLRRSLDSGVRVMMDSGAFSFHEMTRSRGKASIKKQFSPEEIKTLRESVIGSYRDYCREHAKEWDFYLNFDYRPHAPLVYAMQKKLERQGMKPIPVFHGDQDLSWLEKYIDEGHKLIAIGGLRTFRPSWKHKRTYLDIVFNLAEKYRGVRLHGLATTSLSLMFMYPWASVDSATWAIMGAYGQILYINKHAGRMGPLHVSDKESTMDNSYSRMPKQIQRGIQEMVEQEGFDFQQLRTHGFWRCVYNAKMFSTHVMDMKQTIEKTRVRWESLV